MTKSWKVVKKRDKLVKKCHNLARKVKKTLKN